MIINAGIPKFYWRFKIMQFHII